MLARKLCKHLLLPREHLLYSRSKKNEIKGLADIYSSATKHNDNRSDISVTAVEKKLLDVKPHKRTRKADVNEPAEKKKED